MISNHGSGIIATSEVGGKKLLQDALEFQFRELRDRILNAKREIDELKGRLNETIQKKADIREKNTLQEQVDYLKKNVRHVQ